MQYPGFSIIVLPIIWLSDPFPMFPMASSIIMDNSLHVSSAHLLTKFSISELDDPLGWILKCICLELKNLQMTRSDTQLNRYILLMGFRF